MSKIELSLESNINLIVSQGMFGYKLKVEELDKLIHRLSKNFHNHYCQELSSTALSLWMESQDRKHVHRILSTAYDIELEWRDRNKLRSMLKVISNPHSFDVVSINQLLTLPVPTELELRDLLSVLTEEDFRKTPYWKCINNVALQLYGFECQIRINGIQCGRSQDIESEYLNIESVRGLLHRNYKSDLIAVCSDCKARGRIVAGSGAHSHKVYVQEK